MYFDSIAQLIKWEFTRPVLNNKPIIKTGIVNTHLVEVSLDLEGSKKWKTLKIELMNNNESVTQFYIPIKLFLESASISKKITTIYLNKFGRFFIMSHQAYKNPNVFSKNITSFKMSMARYPDGPTFSINKLYILRISILS